MIDLEPSGGWDELAITKACQADSDVRLHGEFTVQKSIRIRSSVRLDLNDAVLRQSFVKTQFGEPMLRIMRGSNDVVVEGGTFYGSNTDLKDAVNAGNEGYHGITVGGGSKHVAIVGTTVRDVWGDFLFVGSFGDGRDHNLDIVVDGLEGVGSGRHAFTARDCDGLVIKNTVTRSFRRMWFDHEPKPYEQLLNVRFDDNESASGGGRYWFALQPRATTVLGDVTVTNHYLTKGHYKIFCGGGVTPRGNVKFADLYRSPTLAEPAQSTLVQVKGTWASVRIERLQDIVDYPVLNAVQVPDGSTVDLTQIVRAA